MYAHFELRSIYVSKDLQFCARLMIFTNIMSNINIHGLCLVVLSMTDAAISIEMFNQLRGQISE